MHISIKFDPRVDAGDLLDSFTKSTRLSGIIEGPIKHGGLDGGMDLPDPIITFNRKSVAYVRELLETYNKNISGTLKISEISR